MMNNNTIFKSLWIGFKKGYNTPTLPENLLQLQQKVYIRFFRGISGLSALFLTTGWLDQLVLILGLESFRLFFVLTCTIFTLLFSIYSIYISYHRVKHMYKVWNSDELNVH